VVAAFILKFSGHFNSPAIPFSIKHATRLSYVDTAIIQGLIAIGSVVDNADIY
jgi:hypothetical protein